jgi:SAM-dependent methyltransferase
MGMSPKGNIDEDVVSGFGDEWQHFDRVDGADYEKIFEDYFHIFPWDSVSPDAEGFDLGCGAGPWAKFVSSRVKLLHCIDASGEALQVARNNLRERRNVQFHHASVDAIPLPDSSQDFGYSLGVLHHVPDTAGGLRACVNKLKTEAPFLLYLYFAFDNKPRWYRWLWSLSELVRKSVSRAPHPVRFAFSQALAFTVYWPLSRLARILEKLGIGVDSVPLAYYRDKSMYAMRTAALDRFGTRLEQRFTKIEIEEMMRSVGLERIIFSEKQPYWVALGYKA